MNGCTYVDVAYRDLGRGALRKMLRALTKDKSLQNIADVHFNVEITSQGSLQNIADADFNVEIEIRNICCLPPIHRPCACVQTVSSYFVHCNAWRKSQVRFDDAPRGRIAKLQPLTKKYQKCTSKGIGRQGLVLKPRNSLPTEPMPCRRTPLPAQLQSAPAYWVPSLMGTLSSRETYL